ncbi:MAG TPA: SRPBCC family protein, partial [Thermoanaerobaculia bacterium]|nr:SRPBCC family protein [Thermoanaerobaculia bacterium]
TDFHKWEAWSPWEKIDPTMKRDIGGAPSGKGAVYAWEGKGKAGAGRMEITDVSPSKVSIKLDFLKPMKSSNTVDFTLRPQNDPAPATNVTWEMNGPMLFAGKVMSLFFDMDKMVGKDFEAGLANLKAAAEK